MFTMQNLNPISRFGFASIEPLLKKKEANEVRRFFEAKPCYLSHSERDARVAGLTLLPLNQARISHHYGVHQRRDVLNAPHLLEIANHPNVLSLVKDYLGCDPVILHLNVWWSFKKRRVAPVAQRFHRDPSAGKVCALFVYLTDADETTGEAEDRVRPMVGNYKDGWFTLHSTFAWFNDDFTKYEIAPVQVYMPDAVTTKRPTTGISTWPIFSDKMIQLPNGDLLASMQGL